MIDSSIDKLSELQTLLPKLDNKNFSKRIKILGDGTLGQHIRHIIEFYICLLDGIEGSEVNYDNRNRDVNLETDVNGAWDSLYQIKLRLQKIKNNKMMTLITNLSSDEGRREVLVSSLYRELAYCQEHCTHHQALIKVGLQELNLLHLVDPNFGVAHSTVKYRNNFTKVYR